MDIGATASFFFATSGIIGYSNSQFTLKRGGGAMLSLSVEIMSNDAHSSLSVIDLWARNEQLAGVREGAVGFRIKSGRERGIRKMKRAKQAGAKI